MRAVGKAGYEFTLSASFSRTKTPAGVVVPFVRDAQTGFHFLIDHLLAAPGLRAKHNFAEHFQRSGDPGEVNDLLPQTDAESCPAVEAKCRRAKARVWAT
jgi:hypothetical protein